jgi:dihydrofolate reductase
MEKNPNMPYHSIPISLIAAVSSNFVLGDSGKIPWHLSKDFAYFKEKTLNKPIIMGRKTFESIGRPLPKRKNIIISRKKDYQPSNTDVSVYNNVHDALDCASSYLTLSDSNDKEIMIIGGADIYDLFLPFADFVYLTQIDLICDGDTFFPALCSDQWKLISSNPANEMCDDTLIHFDFNVYEKR